MTVSAVLELRFLKLDNEFQIFSLITAVLVLLFIFLLWLAALLISLIHSNNADHPLVIKRFGVLFESNSYYFAVHLTLNICSAVILVMLSHYTRGPLAIQAVLHFLVSFTYTFNLSLIVPNLHPFYLSPPLSHAQHFLLVPLFNACCLISDPSLHSHTETLQNTLQRPVPK